MLSSTVEVAVKAVGVMVLGGFAVIAAGRWFERQLDSRLAILQADHKEIREELPVVRANERARVIKRAATVATETTVGLMRDDVLREQLKTEALR